MNKFLVFLAVLVLTHVVSAKEKSVFEAWNETEINSENVKFFVNQQKCYAKKEVLWGCFEALNILANSTLPEVKQRGSFIKFLSEEYLNKYPQRVLKKFSQHAGLTIALVEVFKEEEIKNKTPRELFLKSRAENAEYHLTLTNMMAAPQLRFEKIVDDLIAKQLKQEKSKYFMSEAINEYLKFAYDPHTTILPTSTTADYFSDPKPLFGIGVAINENEKGPLVLETYEDSPAEKAGMLAGDIITHVDGKPVGGQPLDETVSKIKGPENTIVNLKILREGKTLDVAVKRGKVSPENVTAKIVSDFENSYIYAKLRRFSENACEKFVGAIITKAQEPGAPIKGIILDFRGNPGGSLWEAMCMGSFFTNNKSIVSVKDLTTGEERQLQPPALRSTLREGSTKILILIDGQSASASELVAAGLQDYKTAWVAGERSFGKGTVQQVFSPAETDPFNINSSKQNARFEKIKKEFNLPNGVSIKKTIERFYSPRKISNQIVGVTPDFDVPVKPGLSEADRFYFREENLFETSVSSVNPPRPPLRTTEVGDMAAKCLVKGKSEKLYETKVKAKQRVDYQLLKAQEILNCDYEVLEKRRGFMLF